MTGSINIEVRISKDSSQKPRFTKEEIDELIKTENIKFHRNLLLRISDGKVVGEITDYKIK